MEGRHERRPSDAASVRTTHLPIRGGDPAMRKSSTATTATITPETSIPHFSSIHRADVFSSGRPGSSNSMAADDLKRLTREDSAGHSGNAGGEPGRGSRWGSVISGLWGTRRRESGATSLRNHTRGEVHGHDDSPTKASTLDTQVPGRSLESGVERTSAEEREVFLGQSSLGAEENSAPARQVPGTGEGFTEPTNITPKVQRIPDPNGAYESPVKTSININDGVIEVDVPFPDYITSFETAVSSPSSSGYLSTPGFGTGFDGFEQSCRISVDGDVPVNVAGWLQHYHPDFILQAIPTQEDIIEQVKASMQAEPVPSWVPNIKSSEQCSERWLDVGTALIADTTTFTLTRIRHRRLVKLKPAVDHFVAVAGMATPAAQTPSDLRSNGRLREEFIEEPLFELDDVVTDAVERVIAISADMSKAGSGASSRSTSKRRERRDSSSTQSEAPMPGQPPTQLSQEQVRTLLGSGSALEGAQEVPRSQCKAVMLSALEEVVKEVVEERDRETGLEAESEAARRSPQSRMRSGRVETVLREVVRGWLESVDPRD